MLAIISPAKTLDYDSSYSCPQVTQPHFQEETQYLVKKISAYSPKRIAKLMNVSEELAHLNWERYKSFEPSFNKENSRPAIFAFKGDVYLGLDAATLSEADLNRAQKNLGILSGLYGYLKPLDLMQPYRMEMGLPFKVTPAKTNLYKYWGDKILEKLNSEVEGSTGEKLVVNLASNEYSKAAKLNKLNYPVIDVEFKELRPDGSYKVISFLAKKARGLMARFIVQNEIDNAQDLLAFNSEGYYFSQEQSTETKLVFLRDNQ